MIRPIVYTRPDGGVTVWNAAPEWLSGMCNGGGLMFENTRGYLDNQIALKAPRMGEKAAHRFVMASAFGGCTTAEAYDVLADAEARPFGTAAELWDRAMLPDRWFRDAWRRSPDGGPIWIDFEAARALQAEYVANAVTTWNKNAETEDLAASLLRPTNGPAIIALDTTTMRRGFAECRSIEQLRCVWPSELPASSRIPSVRRKDAAAVGAVSQSRAA